MGRATTTKSKPAGSKGTRTRGAAATAAKARNKAIAAEADEFVEVKGGGDFPATWDFDEQPELIGTFLGSEVKEIKGKDRTIHSFEVDGETVNAWGAAILDSRLEDIDQGSRVKVVKTGDKIPTKAGRGAWEFKVFVARGALR